MAVQIPRVDGRERLQAAIRGAGPVDAVVFTNGLLHVDFAKTCHGLLRGSERFNVRAVIDTAHAGKDAGEVMDGRRLGVPVYAKLRRFLEETNDPPAYFVIGVAFSGGILPDSCRNEIVAALTNGMHVVNGLHQHLSTDEEFSTLARQYGVDLIDIRRAAVPDKLHFWTGEVEQVPSVIIPVLGTDCAVGKRTTARMIMQALREDGVSAELIYTGQTGWMQGYRHGFLFDATPNDFVSGELERVILECHQDLAPDVILIEGQGALRNPSGPCGSEMLLSTHCTGAILQHDPGRIHFTDHDDASGRVPRAEDEIALINMYGKPVLAVALNESRWKGEQMDLYQAELAAAINLPVVRPLSEGVEELLPVIRALLPD